MKLPLFIGKAVYIVTKPGIYRMLKGSRRVYVYIRVGDEILVTKNWLGLHKTWRLPGGGMQNNETPAQAIKREVKEELGIELEESELKVIQHEAFIEPVKKFTYYLYVLNLTEKLEIHVNETEIMAAEWVRTEELTNMLLSEELKTALANVK